MAKAHVAIFYLLVSAHLRADPDVLVDHILEYPAVEPQKTNCCHASFCAWLGLHAVARDDSRSSSR